ncbi:hypothetical protein [Streptomyces sp. NRRL B-2790]|uniref:hypothetical protein n=1 Tax=Streptomyces sp. NRRL B-2790 TaxID=1463835 RepID=UPI00356A2D59
MGRVRAAADRLEGALGQGEPALEGHLVPQGRLHAFTADTLGLPMMITVSPPTYRSRPARDVFWRLRFTQPQNAGRRCTRRGGGSSPGKRFPRVRYIREHEACARMTGTSPTTSTTFSPEPETSCVRAPPCTPRR